MQATRGRYFIQYLKKNLKIFSDLKNWHRSKEKTRIDRIGLKESKHTSLLLPSFIYGSAKFFSIDPRFPEPKPIQKIIV